MTTPLDRMLDDVKWRTLPQPHVAMRNDPSALYATHEGDVAVGPGLRFKCYVLNDGQRVFDADDVASVFGMIVAENA